MIIDAIKEKKGNDINLIDLSKIMNSPADFFIISSASSKRQINAIARNVIDVLDEKRGTKCWRQEGESSNWRLLDYGDIVIHVLQEDAREYYQLDELWEDGKQKIK